MDPEATLAQLSAAINVHNWSGAVRALDYYYQWRLGGGFQPQMTLTRGDIGVKLSGDTYAAMESARLQDTLDDHTPRTTP